jgi:hypothetical protein
MRSSTVPLPARGKPTLVDTQRTPEIGAAAGGTDDRIEDLISGKDSFRYIQLDDDNIYKLIELKI